MVSFIPSYEFIGKKQLSLERGGSPQRAESGREFSMGLVLVMQGIGGADLGWA